MDMAFHLAKNGATISPPGSIGTQNGVRFTFGSKNGVRFTQFRKGLAFTNPQKRGVRETAGGRVSEPDASVPMKSGQPNLETNRGSWTCGKAGTGERIDGRHRAGHGPRAGG